MCIHISCGSLGLSFFLFSEPRLSFLLWDSTDSRLYHTLINKAATEWFIIKWQNKDLRHSKVEAKPTTDKYKLHYSPLPLHIKLPKTTKFGIPYSYPLFGTIKLDYYVPDIYADLIKVPLITFISNYSNIIGR